MLFSAAATFDPTSRSSVNAARAKLGLPPMDAETYSAWYKRYQKTLARSLQCLDVSPPASASLPDVNSSRLKPHQHRSVRRYSALPAVLSA